ncbi:MAG: hypothetical protein KA967_02470, partial [Methanoculleus sp.]|nr:hypothetical protein [Methanoculleus sp.]
GGAGDPGTVMRARIPLPLLHHFDSARISRKDPVRDLLPLSLVGLPGSTITLFILRTLPLN